MAEIFTSYNNYSITIADLPDGMETPETSLESFGAVYYSPDADATNRLSQHVITVSERDQTIARVVIADFANGLTPDDHSYVLIKDSLIARCGSCLFSVSLPDLRLNWVRKVDFAACFSVYPYEEDVITHGEVSICRLSQQGDLVWEYSGADIFVHLDRGPVFEMHDTYIQLMDFAGGRYRIGYNGKALDYLE